MKYTLHGRKVLGQGGITPDFEVPMTLSPLTADLMIKGAFFGYARKFAAHLTAYSKDLILPKDGEAAAQTAPSKTALTKDFAVDDAIIADFRDYLRANAIAFEDEKFKAARDEIPARAAAKHRVPALGRGGRRPGRLSRGPRRP